MTSLRSFLYTLARILGDVNAIRRGTIHKRIANRVIGRKAVSRMWMR
jgi:hypothetical protein